MTVNKSQPVAGTTQADASSMVADHVWIATDATAGQGLIVRPGNENDVRTVCNPNAVAIKVYPPSGGTFNAGSADIPVVLPPSGSAFFVCIDAVSYTAVLS
jgi:hypothetical protein